MGLFDRMGRVISSNLNALLDRAEDPRKLVDLNLDEMGSQLKAGRQEVVQAAAAEKQLAKRVGELRDEVAKWERRAELALRGGDEALAREALKQKRKLDEQAQSADKARAEQASLALTMRDELDRMDRKLGELSMRKGTLAAQAQTAKGGGSVEGLGARGGSNAFAEFRRMEEKVDGAADEAAARNEVEEALGKGASADALEARFRALERGPGAGARAGAVTSPEVENDLAELKKRIRV